MKLYTEEQVINFAISMISQYEFGNKNILNKELLKESLDCITPIELPSNEEVKKQNRFMWGSHVFGTRDLLIWEQGVKWMLDKLKGGNK